jgi:hypothetical protein
VGHQAFEWISGHLKGIKHSTGYPASFLGGIKHSKGYPANFDGASSIRLDIRPLFGASSIRQDILPIFCGASKHFTGYPANQVRYAAGLCATLLITEIAPL